MKGEKKDLRSPIAKARDEFLEKRAALHGSPSGVYLRNRIDLAFVTGWTEGEKAARNDALEDAAKLVEEADVQTRPDPERPTQVERDDGRATLLEAARAIRALKVRP